MVSYKGAFLESPHLPQRGFSVTAQRHEYCLAAGLSLLTTVEMTACKKEQENVGTAIFSMAY